MDIDDVDIEDRAEFTASDTFTLTRVSSMLSLRHTGSRPHSQSLKLIDIIEITGCLNRRYKADL